MRKKRPNYSAAMRFDDPHDRTPASHPLATILRDENAARVLLLRTDHIDPDPEQPRKYFDPQSLEELTVSVREKGILQPIIVFKQPESDRCMIIDGERRWRAAKAAGLKEIPALLRTPDDALEVALIGNLQRDDFNPIEAAEGLARLKAERGYTDVQLTRIVGKSRPTITELLALNGLPEAVKAECRLTDKWTKTQLLQLLRSGTPREIEARWEAMKRGEVKTALALRDMNRAAKRPAATDRRYRYHYVPPTGAFRLHITFRKRTAKRSDVKAALTAAIKNLPKRLNA